MTEMVRVLYVDDEPDLLTITTLFLEKIGEFQVTTSVSAQESLKNPSIQTFDAIVSDYQMPGMDGIAFLKEVRERFGNIPFILFTGRGREEVVIEAINHGVDFYLQKGGDPTAQFAELAHKIKQAVARKKSENEVVSIFGAVQVGIGVVTDGILLRVNDYLCTMTGYPREELEGRDTRFLYLNDEDHAAVGAMRQQAYLQGCADELEIQWRRKDESIIDVRITVALTDRSNPTAAMIYSAHDITTEKREHNELLAAFEQLAASDEELRGQFEEIASAQQDLKESQQQLAEIAGTIPGVVCQFHPGPDGSMEFSYISSRTLDIFGIDNDPASFFERFLACIEPADRDATLESLHTSVSLQSQIDIEARFVRPSGEQIWFQAIARPGKKGPEIVYNGVLLDITARKKAEEDRSRSEEKFRAIFEKSHEALLLFSGGRCIDCNQFALDLFGYRRHDEIIGLTASDLSPRVQPDGQDSRSASDVHVRDAREKGSSLFEWVHQKKDGTTFIAYVLLSKFELGGTGVILSSIRDITRQKQSQDLIWQSEKKYRNIVDNSPYGMHFYELKEDESLIFMGANPSADRILKVSHERFIGETIEEAFPGLVGTEIPDQYRNIARSGSTWQTEQVSYDEGGISGAYSVTAFQVSPGFMAALFIDTTEPKRAERALAESEARTWWILEHEPFPLAIVDKNGVISFRNKRFIQLIGHTADDVPTLQEWWQKAYPDPDYRQQVIATWKEAVRHAGEDNTDISPAEYRVTCKNGEERVFEISGITFGNGYLATFVDLTDKKRAEEALEKRLIALTQPLGDTSVTFDDLFDLDEIQHLQDDFAKATGVAMLLTRPDGTSITKPSNFCKLCNDIVRRTPAGRERCQRSDSTLGNLHVGGPFIHTCLSAGLWGAGASIVLGGKHIANWLIGQVRNETQTEEMMREYAREIEVDDDDFIEAFRQVPVMSSRQFEHVANALYTLANQISKTAYQNVQQARILTEHRITEEALRESEERFRLIVENSTDIFYRQNIRTGQFEYFSPKIQDILGFTPQDMAIMNIEEQKAAIHPEDLPSLVSFATDIIEADAKGEKTIAREFRIRKKNGEYCWMHGNYTLTRDAGGSPSMIIGSLHDITKRKEAEEALRESEEKYRGILDNMQDVYIRTDHNGIITMASPSTTRMFGYGISDEVIGLPIRSLFHDPEKSGDLGRELLEGRMITDYTSKGLRKDGTTFWMAFNVQAIKDEEGRIKGFEGIIRDISERKSMEQAIREANRKLNLLNSLARHDILNQLTLLQGYTQIVTKNERDPLILDYLSRINTSSNTIYRQIEFMRTYQELGIHAPGWFRLSETVDKAGCKMAVFSDSCRDIEVFSDPMLERVFFNLFENAVRHGEHVTRIGVHCEQTSEGVLITIEDDGIGIPADEKEKIFEKGFGKNTGFGLFLVREILSITGLTIRETGSQGKGAKFEILVPNEQYRIIKR